MMVDDPNIALYAKAVKESLSCYNAWSLTPKTIEIEKVFYVYLEGLLTMKMKPIFLDKFGITYDPMEQRIG